MSKLGINTGAAPDDGTGNSLLLGAAKINSNFTELYSLLGAGSTITLVPGIVTSIVASGEGVNVSGTGQVTITGSATTAFVDAESLNVVGVSTFGASTFTGASAALSNVSISGVATGSFVGPIVGNVTGNLTGNVTGNVSAAGSVTAATLYGDGVGVTGVTATSVTGSASVNTTGIITATSFSGSGGTLSGITTANQFVLGADGTTHYTFIGIGLTEVTNDPTLYLARGQRYEFVNNIGSHPFRLQNTVNGSVGVAYSNGVTNNDVSNGTLVFEVPFNAPNAVWYQCTSHVAMGGSITIYPSI